MVRIVVYPPPGCSNTSPLCHQAHIKSTTYLAKGDAIRENMTLDQRLTFVVIEAKSVEGDPDKLDNDLPQVIAETLVM